MTKKILVINLGSTSTKIAVYHDQTRAWDASIAHTAAELAGFADIMDQADMRYDVVMRTLAGKGEDPAGLDAVVARGGPFASVESGAYEINDAVVDTTVNHPLDQHPSLCGMVIAHKIARDHGIKAYIYDGVTIDEMIPLVKITGLKAMMRLGRGHNLNMRAQALRWSRDNGFNYADKKILVAHLGGGITLSLHVGGKIIDMISDDEGPFTPERAGGLPYFQVVDMCFRPGAVKKDVMRQFQRKGGLIDHLGTADSREAEARIAAGDEYAALVYEAMALAVAKNVAKLSVVADGGVDVIILTGGIAHSAQFTGMIERRIRFIAPVVVMPGENEMEALAFGCLRVLTGEEEANVYVRPAAPAGS
jgi:butyrate kinase